MSPDNTSSCCFPCFSCKLSKDVAHFRSFWPWKSGALHKCSHSSFLIQTWFDYPALILFLTLHWCFVSGLVYSLCLKHLRKKKLNYFLSTCVCKEWTLKLSVAWMDYMGRKGCWEARLGRDCTFQEISEALKVRWVCLSLNLSFLHQPMGMRSYRYTTKQCPHPQMCHHSSRPELLLLLLLFLCLQGLSLHKAGPPPPWGEIILKAGCSQKNRNSVSVYRPKCYSLN